MPQDPAEVGRSVGQEVTALRSSRLRRTLVLVVVSLGLVSAGAAISATAAGAASNSSGAATVQGSSSDASTTQAQEDEREDDGRHDCPEREEAEQSA